MTVFHAIYHVLVIYHHMLHNSCSLLLAATWVVYMPLIKVLLSAICYSSTACYTACYLLPRAIQFVICCCYTPCSLLVVAACHRVCYLLPHAVISVVACCTVCCLLPHTIWFVICCRTPLYLLPHAV